MSIYTFFFFVIHKGIKKTGLLEIEIFLEKMISIRSTNSLNGNYYVDSRSFWVKNSRP
jgi:hypothetical protein